MPKKIYPASNPRYKLAIKDQEFSFDEDGTPLDPFSSATPPSFIVEHSQNPKTKVESVQLTFVGGTAIQGLMEVLNGFMNCRIEEMPVIWTHIMDALEFGKLIKNQPLAHGKPAGMQVIQEDAMVPMEIVPQPTVLFGVPAALHEAVHKVVVEDLTPPFYRPFTALVAFPNGKTREQWLVGSPGNFMPFSDTQGS
jgi:hypothetical protein